MKGHMLMSSRELLRKSVFEWVKGGHGTLVQAAEQLGLSYRQVKRSYGRWRKQGDKGLVHRSRGRRSNRVLDARRKKAILRRCKARYVAHELGPTLMAEKLLEDGYRVDHDTLRRWLMEEGLWSKKRKRSEHRQRRERRARFGELLQLDGSHHRWFGDEHPQCCLMNIIDDATGHGMGLMAGEETTEAAMRLLWKWVETHGIPCALYTDRKSVFVSGREPTIEEQLAGEQPRTVFGHACAKLGIRIIRANSPQAKGRVERNHGVYQDRFVKELRLQRIATIDGANRLLENGFVTHLNAKFAVVPADATDAHRTVPQATALDDIFAFEDRRVLANDWTLRHDNHQYQILEDNHPLPKPKDKIVVRRRLDGVLVLEYKGKPLHYRELTQAQRRARTVKTKAGAAPPIPAKPKKPHTKTNSPWRQGCSHMRADTKTQTP